ncbi:MAG: DM13 domain-containing protein [Pseudomonadota bacterium]
MERPFILSLIATLALTAAALGLVAASASAQTVASGKFRGAGGHISSGGVRVVRDGNTVRVVFAKNFRLNGAPDPRVAFGNGKYVRGTIFARLRKLRGSQSYTVPARLNVGRFSQVWLWCKKFNAPLAVARIR